MSSQIHRQNRKAVKTCVAEHIPIRMEKKLKVDKPVNYMQQTRSRGNPKSATKYYILNSDHKINKENTFQTIYFNQNLLFFFKRLHIYPL